MKKLISVLLCISIAVCSPAYSSAEKTVTLSPAADKAVVSAGDTVTVTLTLSEELKNVTTWEARLYYDTNLFTFMESALNAPVSADISSEPDTVGNYIKINVIDIDSKATVAAGDIGTVSFTVKSGVESDISTCFKCAVTYLCEETTTVINNLSAPGEAALSTGNITVAAAAVEYCVSLSEVSKTANTGDTITVTASISCSNSNVTTYNAADMVFSYDTSKLSFVSCDEPVASSKDGKINVRFYGEDKTFYDTVVLTFNVKAGGFAAVSLDSARIDRSKNAAIQDAPDALLSDCTCTIAVQCRITKPEHVTGKATAEPGNSYSFKLDDGYTLKSVTMGEDEITPSWDGSRYTISTVTGDVAIEINPPEGTVLVTVSGTGISDVTVEDVATVGKDFTFTLNRAAGYNYSITVTSGGTDITSKLTGAYTIPGEEICEGKDIVIIVDKTGTAPAGEIEVSEYVKTADESKYIYLVRVSGTLSKGQTFFFGSEPMYLSQYGEGTSCYSYLLVSDRLENAKKTADSYVAIGVSASETLDRTADANGTGLVDINDAQLIYNMYNGIYSDFTTASVKQFLLADVNGDAVINITDAVAAISAIE